jgi:hypothetical protein
MNPCNAPADSFLPPLSALVGAELSHPLPSSPAEEQDAATSREQPEAPEGLQAPDTSTFAAMDLDSGAPALPGPQHMEQVVLGSAIIPLPIMAPEQAMPPLLAGTGLQRPALDPELLLGALREQLQLQLQLSGPSQAALLPLAAPAPLPAALPLFHMPIHQQAPTPHAAPASAAQATHKHLASLSRQVLDQWPRANRKMKLQIFRDLMATLDSLKQSYPEQPLSALLPGCYYDSFPDKLLPARGPFAFLGPFTLPEGCRLNLNGPKTSNASDYEAKVGSRPGRQHAMWGAVSGTRPEESADEERLARRWGHGWCGILVASMVCGYANWGEVVWAILVGKCCWLTAQQASSMGGPLAGDQRCDMLVLQCIKPHSQS